MLEFYTGLIFLCILAVCFVAGAVIAAGIIKEWIEDLKFEIWRRRNNDKK